MNNLRYLNAVLTVIAVLLSVHVYLDLAGSPAGATLAPVPEARAEDRPRGIGSTAAREQAQLDELRTLNDGLRDLKTTLTGGGVRVKVDSMPNGD
ncbi:MAG: hypothetical protein AAF800_12645 [Planctomycetota bacterium]